MSASDTLCRLTVLDDDLAWPPQKPLDPLLLVVCWAAQPAKELSLRGRGLGRILPLFDVALVPELGRLAPALDSQVERTRPGDAEILDNEEAHDRSKLRKQDEEVRVCEVVNALKGKHLDHALSGVA